MGAFDVEQPLPRRKDVLDEFLNRSLSLALLNVHPIGGSGVLAH